MRSLGRDSFKKKFSGQRPDGAGSLIHCAERDRDLVGVVNIARPDQANVVGAG